MPKRAKKKAEPQAAGDTLVPRHEPDEPELRAASQTGIGAEMEVRSQDETATASDEGQAEAVAEAADTFEQAYEDRIPSADLNTLSEAATDAHAEPEAPEEEAEPEDAAAERPPARLERLQKILSQSGVASRRHAEEMIVEGRVQVNGRVVTELGSKADPDRDHIRVDGKLLRGAERLRYFMLNKPKGYVTTVSDPEGRPTVMQFFKKMNERLYPVGRLDYQSEGLLLVTNDGDLANRLTRPASGVERTYLVKVSGRPAPDELEKLRAGLAIDRGRPGEGRVHTAPANIQQVRTGDNPWFEIVLTEGRNRELRKMFEEIGHHVEKIRRVGYGPLVLDLEPGRFRELEPEEVARLRQAAEGKWQKPRPKSKPTERRQREFSGRRADERQPSEKRFTEKRKSGLSGKDWKREDRGERRAGTAPAERRRAPGRNAPMERTERPVRGGDKRERPDRAFGERARRQQEPRERRGEGRLRTGDQEGRQQFPDRRRLDSGRGPRFDSARGETRGFQGGKGRSAGPRPPARDAAGARFDSARGERRGFQGGKSRSAGPRPPAGNASGARSGKFHPRGAQDRPAAGGSRPSSPRSSNRRTPPRPGGNRPHGPRGKRH